MTRLDEVLAALEARADARYRDGLARYGIETADRVLGVAMNQIQKAARDVAPDHELAAALWDSGVYEARLMTAYVDDPALVTREQMERWTRQLDNWAVCDTLCFRLFDRTPHAFEMVDRWADDPASFVKRTAFALLASLALHDGNGEDEPFLSRLPLIEAGAADERNFVKKGVSWALRAIGGRKSPALRRATRELAQRLAGSRDRSARWVGKDAARAFAKGEKKAASPGPGSGRTDAGRFF